MINFFMLSCREATRLTEQKLFEGKLAMVKELQLFMHLKMCDACKRYAQQSALVEKVFRERLESAGDEAVRHDDPNLPTLSSETKEVILKKFEGHL